MFLCAGLLILNRFLLFKFADLGNFQINTALSNLLFLKGISPYSRDIPSILDNYFSTRGVVLNASDFHFKLPIYQLIFFLPFSLIPDFNWSFSIWLTVNLCIFLACILNFIKLLKWEPEKWLRITALVGGMLSFYGISNFLDANTSFIQLFFLLIGLNAVFSEKLILAGILMGIVTIDPFNFMIPLIIILLFLSKQKKVVSVIWFFVMTGLLSLGGFIFDSGWILKFFRNIILERTFFPLIDYNQALLNWNIQISLGSLINLLPILLLIWIIIEFSRVPKQNSSQLFWLLSMVICINPFLIMRETNYASVLYLIPIIFIIFLWEKHSTGKINNIIYGIIGFVSVLLPFAILLFPITFDFISNFHSMNLINSLLLILVLYWIRWWVVIPYDYLNNE